MLRAPADLFACVVADAACSAGPLACGAHRRRPGASGRPPRPRHRARLAGIRRTCARRQRLRAMVVSGSPLASAGRAGHPAAGRQRGGRGGGGGVRARGGAPRGRQHRRRRLHGDPHGRRRRCSTLDYRETAPAPATRDMYLDAIGEPTELSVTGHLAAGVPGAVAGLSRRTGGSAGCRSTRSIAPAIRLARDGFVVDDYRSRSIAERQRSAARVPRLAARASCPAARPPAAGTTLRAARPRRARSRRSATAGADGFYRGSVADLHRRGDGARRRAHHARRPRRATGPIWREPIRISYRGHTIYSMPPASSGGVTMGEILNILEGYDPLPPFGSPALLHREAEAMRRAFTDRNRYLGDPAFVENPIERLLSQGATRPSCATQHRRARHADARVRRRGARAGCLARRTTRWWTPRATR